MTNNKKTIEDDEPTKSERTNYKNLKITIKGKEKSTQSEKETL